MGKRSDFERRDRDFYPTPAEAVAPLLLHLSSGTRFTEPCAGNGALVDHLKAVGHVCMSAYDIVGRASQVDPGEQDDRQGQLRLAPVR
jgi:hypothetical protein